MKELGFHVKITYNEDARFITLKAFKNFKELSKNHMYLIIVSNIAQRPLAYNE